MTLNFCLFLFFVQTISPLIFNIWNLQLCLLMTHIKPTFCFNISLPISIKFQLCSPNSVAICPCLCIFIYENRLHVIKHTSPFPLSALMWVPHVTLLTNPKNTVLCLLHRPFERVGRSKFSEKCIFPFRKRKNLWI